MQETTSYDDIIDSRDVIARIDDLREESELLSDNASYDDSEISRDDVTKELTALTDLAKQGEDYLEDWQYGVTLVRDSYFETYAQEFAEELDLIPANTAWPFTCIDWAQAARELQMDYTSVEYDGVTYWAR